MSELRERPAAQFKRIGGRLCLDFANTVQSWRAGASAQRFEAVEDRLPAYADLLAWSSSTGILDDTAARRLLAESARKPREAVAVQERARRLRHAIYRIGWQLARRTQALPDDLGVLQAEVRLARDRQRLDAAPEGLQWRLAEDATALDLPLWHVALSAEACFTTGDVSRLHVCPGEECGWMFEDKTRNRSRQWCDMSDCGNVAKVRRFRSRRAGGRAGRRR